MHWTVGAMAVLGCRVAHADAAQSEGRAAEAKFEIQSEAVAPRLEGALGLIAGWGPAFGGSSDFRLKAELAGFIRYGRFTLTGAGGFTTRRHDEVQRGLTADLVRHKDWRVNLSGRFDRGRRDAVSGQLAGMGNIDPTLRARLGARWSPDPAWAVSAGTNVDVLGRVGGAVMDLGASRTWVISPDSRLAAGAFITGGSQRYMQAWHGVTRDQSAATGYPTYHAKAGLRDVGVNVTWRHEFRDAALAMFVGAGATQLLGSAAASPLATQRLGWGISGGLVRRF